MKASSGFKSIKKQKLSSNFAAKIKLRKWLAEKMDCKISVFEAYVGSGGMQYSAWDKSVGVDKNFSPHTKNAYLGDTMHLIRCIDLNQFNVFDVDAFADPWPAIAEICKRRKSGRIGIVLTASGLGNTLAGGSKWLNLMAKTQAKSNKIDADEKISRAINGIAEMRNAKIECQSIFKRKSMTYCALIVA